MTHNAVSRLETDFIDHRSGFIHTTGIRPNDSAAQRLGPAVDQHTALHLTTEGDTGNLPVFNTTFSQKLPGGDARCLPPIKRIGFGITRLRVLRRVMTVGGLEDVPRDGDENGFVRARSHVVRDNVFLRHTVG